VRFLDPVPQEELVPLYQACAVFVLPSLNDVYPNAVLEAMACGRPCVVTDAVGVAELVLEADAGLVVPPDNPEALAAAISEVLAMPASQRDEMGARGRRIVERVCATQVIAAQTVAAYRDAIRERATQRA
jgi:glycosyltransferase involved in cell wall biosynthesis